MAEFRKITGRMSLQPRIRTVGGLSGDYRTARTFRASERSLRRAIELGPEQTEAYLLYGQLLEARGTLESGLAKKRKALELEPRSPAVHFSISFSYWHQRRYEETIEWANKTLALDPAHPHAREFLAGGYLKKGDFDQWLEENFAHAKAHGVPASALEPVREAYTHCSVTISKTIAQNVARKV